jgi:hypothetical protein
MRQQYRGRPENGARVVVPTHLTNQRGGLQVCRPPRFAFYMDKADQFVLPITFEGAPDPRPKLEKRKAVAVKRKPPQREATVVHPQQQQSKAC